MDLAVTQRRHAVDELGIEACFVHLCTELVVDAFDDLENSGEEETENGDIPLFECLCHDRVVSISECSLNDLPCLCPLDAVLVDQKSHELRDSYDRVCVIELDRVVLGEIVEIVAVILLISVDDVLQRSGNEEVLLSYTENLSVVRSVVRIENSPDVLNAVSLDDCVVESLRIEEVEVELLSGFSLPESQEVNVLCAVTSDREVAGNSPDIDI